MSKLTRAEFREVINVFLSIEQLENELIRIDGVRTSKLSFLDGVKHEGIRDGLVSKRAELTDKLSPSFELSERGRIQLRELISVFLSIEQIENELKDMDSNVPENMSFLDQVKYEGAQSGLLRKRSELENRIGHVVNISEWGVV